jgi:hypothetical protein
MTIHGSDVERCPPILAMTMISMDIPAMLERSYETDHSHNLLTESTTFKSTPFDISSSSRLRYPFEITGNKDSCKS